LIHFALPFVPFPSAALNPAHKKSSSTPHLIPRATPFVLHSSSLLPNLTPQQCEALKTKLPQQTYHSSTPDSAPAPDLASSFFAMQQQGVVPACWFTLTSASDISTAINIIRENGCHFAVKSGDHAPNARSSRAEGGVTI
jgi:hypothetical protein